MTIEFPWAAFNEAQRQKNQNRQDFNQNIASLGQNLGQGFNTIGQSIQEQKKKQLLAQIVQAMQQKGQPIPGPAGYKPPGTSTGTVTAGQPIDNTSQINALLTQYDPDIAIKEQLKQSTGSPWTVVPNMLVGGKPVQENKRSGLLRPGAFEVTPTGRGNASFGPGQITWDTASPEDKQLAQALYEGRVRPFDLSYRDRGAAVKLANEYGLKNNKSPYKSYAGETAAKTAGAFAAGKFGQNQLSLNTALGHVNSAYDAYQGVQNTNQQWLNMPLNKLRTATNNPNVVKLGLTLNALRGELANVFKNSGGTDQEIASWNEYLNENLTPTQVNAAIPQIDELLRSRLSALDFQRQSGMGGRAEGALLSPKASKISERFGAKKGTEDQAAIQWAKQNPNDPRAKRILQVNGL